jgi:hypothetical protein
VNLTDIFYGMKEIRYVIVIASIQPPKGGEVINELKFLDCFALYEGSQ